ncbi:MAG TPA: peptidylprolyl isomerase, partial [Hyphomicrobiales bacterium]|nr:peptidylprolyl isomerase [Hyphomicrobiales bacterium]
MPPPPPMQMPVMQTPTPQAINTPGPEARVPARIDVPGNAAVVNGHPITNDQLVEEYLKDGGQPTLNELIDRELVDQAAAKAHVTVTPAEISAKLADAKKQFMAQLWMRSPGITWAQFLTSQGRSESFVRENIRMTLLLEKLVAKTLPPISLAGKVHLYHILLLTTPQLGHTPHTDADAQAQLAKIRADIVSGKITFQEAAKKYSEDSTASKGGDLGW